MESHERIQAACDFLLQSPPGEINDVLNGLLIHFLFLVTQTITVQIDVRNIISDDELLQEGIVPALKRYNLAQFITVDVPETNHQVCAALLAQSPP